MVKSLSTCFDPPGNHKENLLCLNCHAVCLKLKVRKPQLQQIKISEAHVDISNKIIRETNLWPHKKIHNMATAR
jgi:hypothetical protein